MNRESFLNALREKLSYLPQDDVEERIAFYSEMIDDRIEEGMTEEEATASIGAVDQISEHIMSEVPLPKLLIEKVKPKRKLRPWEIVLLALGSPVWVPLALAAVCVLLAVYVVIWSVAASFYAVDLSIAAGAVFSIPSAVQYWVSGNRAGGFFMVGAGLALAGLAILLFFFSGRIARGVVKLTGRFLLWLKSLFTGKEDPGHA